MTRDVPLKITRSQLVRAGADAGLSSDNVEAIWRGLQRRPDLEARFEPAHVGYFFGALLVIGAMGWFMTRGWDTFRGWQLAVIAIGYASVFILVGRSLWPKPMFRVPGSLFIAMAVCMVPLAVYGVERQFHLWPAGDPDSYSGFHPYIKASWVVMEIATVLASGIALRFFRFPFLTAPAAYALWYMSMDLTALMFGKQWTWKQECRISVVFGLVMLLVSYAIERRTDLDYSYWGYLFGLLTFTGGLTLMDSGNQWAKLGYGLIHLALIATSITLQRKVFLVFGAIGVFCYLGNEAYTYFRDSVAFPFVLSLIGLGIIVAAMKFKKNEAALQETFSAWLPQGSRRGSS